MKPIPATARMAKSAFAEAQVFHDAAHTGSGSVPALEGDFD
ncbi:hypothetical protein [Rothia nasimurium]|nr:hypothetical protein [Rothia nasimurium]